MASVISASFWYRAISKSETCFCQWASRNILVISRCPIALLISSWSKTTSSGRVPASAPGVLVGGIAWSIGLVTSGVATHGDTWEDVSSGLGGSSTVGEELPDAWAGGIKYCMWQELLDLSNHADMAPDLGGCSRAICVGEVGAEVLQGAEALGTWSPAVNWERSTCKNVGSSSIPVPQASDSGSDVTTGSRPPLSPSRYTTQLSNCKSRHTYNWWRQLHELLLGRPLNHHTKMTLLSKRTYWVSPLSYMKA